MRNKKFFMIAAAVVMIIVATIALTACNTEEEIYEQIFATCAKQTDLAVTVKQGDVTVYTYKDGVGSSDFEGIFINEDDFVGAAQNAGKKLSLADFTADTKKSYDEVSGAFEIEGAFADAKTLLGVDVTANVHIKGNYINGTVEIYKVTYRQNGLDVEITLA